MQGAEQTAEREPAGGSVLWRHVRAQAARRVAADPATARPDPAPPAPARTPERAIASAIGRAAERVHGLPLFFDRIQTGHAVLAELAELVPEPALISVVEGPGDALGVVAICPGLLTSVIEMQAVGRISARAATTRRPTRTDGAICADFLNACLAELGAELSGQPGFRGLGGYRYASFLDDCRPLELLLDDVPFRRISINLRAGAAGQRDGQMLLLLPAAPQTAALPPVETAVAPAGDAVDPTEIAAEGALAAAVHAVPINLYGILCRRMISLGELRALTPGAMISLPHDALDSATLETATGQQLFRGKLGEYGGRHALRLQPASSPAARGHGDADLATDSPVPGMDFTPDLGPGLDADPIDLAQPDPFRPDEPAADAMTLDFAATDLSAWEDEPTALAPLSIG